MLAANIVISVTDAAGEGFNDPNLPSNPDQNDGSNSGTTLGEMRLVLFNTAAKIWGDLLQSNQTITVDAAWPEADFGECVEGQGATLGFAGTRSTFANFGAGQADTAYHSALAESLANSDLSNGSDEIRARFNPFVDTDPNCPSVFYYGLNDNAPSGTAALFSTVLHELGHGLGFASIRSRTTGEWTGSGKFPDAFSRNLLDLDIGKTWPEMTNQERLDSSLNDPHLVWTGANVTSESASLLDPTVEVVVNSPPSIAGVYPSVLGDEPNIDIPAQGVTGDTINGDSIIANPCENFDDPAFSGSVPLFNESDGCSALLPTIYSERRGSVGVLIASTQAEGVGDVGGIFSTPTITIPYVGITRQLANDIRSAMAGAAPPGADEVFADGFEELVNTDPVNVTIRRSPDVLMGQNDNKLRMYAPAVLESGSSVSHWTTDAKPDLLMEPFLSRSLIFGDVDLTLAAFLDMGWKKN